MLTAILKSGFKYFNAGWKSYCTVKVAEKTGMSVPEIMVYRDSVKCCSDYCCKKLSVFIKDYAKKSRVKSL